MRISKLYKLFFFFPSEQLEGDCR